MTKKRPEILSPAGSPEQLYAAVRAGADAVYLGAGAFNARRSAANFSKEELCEAVRYCHERGVAVYFLLNTLVFDDELREAEELARLACSLSVDGIIIQDTAVADIFRRCAPEMNIHASTQMTVHNAAALDILRALGFTRAVLSRELSGEEIKEITARGKELGIETEVFVHGALCMSVSGQCFMSAALGTRSGNRGMCAQPCRLPFSSGGLEHCLSLKDMSHIPHIDELAEMGVASLKIEGRMKRPEYCAAATAACRLKRDRMPIPTELSSALERVFSRSGFTDGYFTAKRGRVMFGHRTKEDAADSAALSYLHSIYRTEYQSAGVDMLLTVKNGEDVTLTVSDGDGNIVSVSGGAAQISENAISEAPLSQTGGTPYFVKSIKKDTEKGLGVRPSALKAMRREALTLLSEKRAERKPVPFRHEDMPYIPHKTAGKPDMRAVVRTYGQMLAAGLCDKIYVPLEAADTWLPKAVERFGEKIAVEAPRALFCGEDEISRMLERAAALGIKECMIHNIGLIAPVREAGLDIYGGFGLNVTNTAALGVYERLGLRGCELSCELTVKRINALGGELPRGVMIYGRMPLMLVRNCPARAGAGCPPERRGEGDFCTITDRYGKKFPVACREGKNGAFSEVFNIIPVCIVDKSDEIGCTDSFFLRFSVENSVETEEIIKNAAAGHTLSNTGFTRGLYYRGAQ